MNFDQFMRPPPDAADDPQAFAMAVDSMHPQAPTEPPDENLYTPSSMSPPAPDADVSPPDDALKAAILEQAEKAKGASEQFQESVASRNEQSQQQALQMLKGNIDEQSH